MHLKCLACEDQFPMLRPHINRSCIQSNINPESVPLNNSRDFFLSPSKLFKFPVSFLPVWNQIIHYCPIDTQIKLMHVSHNFNQLIKCYAMLPENLYFNGFKHNKFFLEHFWIWNKERNDNELPITIRRLYRNFKIKNLNDQYLAYETLNRIIKFKNVNSIEIIKVNLDPIKACTFLDNLGKIKRLKFCSFTDLTNNEFLIDGEFGNLEQSISRFLARSDFLEQLNFYMISGDKNHELTLNEIFYNRFLHYCQKYKNLKKLSLHLPPLHFNQTNYYKFPKTIESLKINLLNYDFFFHDLDHLLVRNLNLFCDYAILHFPVLKHFSYTLKKPIALPQQLTKNLNRLMYHLDKITLDGLEFAYNSCLIFNSRLKKLNLKNSLIHINNLLQLRTNSDHWENLTHLSLNNLTQHYLHYNLDKIQDWIIAFCPKLANLDLSNNNLNNRSMQILKKLFTTINFKKIILANNKLDDFGVEILCNALKLNHDQIHQNLFCPYLKLDLTSNGLSAESLSKFVKLSDHYTLKLKLADNYISEKKASEFKKLFAKPNLKSIDLSGNFLRELTLKKLFGFLTKSFSNLDKSKMCEFIQLGPFNFNRTKYCLEIAKRGFLIPTKINIIVNCGVTERARFSLNMLLDNFNLSNNINIIGQESLNS